MLDRAPNARDYVLTADGPLLFEIFPSRGARFFSCIGRWGVRPVDADALERSVNRARRPQPVHQDVDQAKRASLPARTGVEAGEAQQGAQKIVRIDVRTDVADGARMVHEQEHGVFDLRAR